MPDQKAETEDSRQIIIAKAFKKGLDQFVEITCTWDIFRSKEEAEKEYKKMAKKVEPEPDWIEGDELGKLLTELYYCQDINKSVEIDERFKAFLRKKRGEDVEKTWYRSWECAQSIYKSEDTKRHLKATGFRIKDLIEFKKREGIE